jgi:hypothetical protein
MKRRIEIFALVGALRGFLINSLDLVENIGRPAADR